MPEITDKELADKRKAVDKLNDQIAAERQKAAARTVNGDRQITMARLQVAEDELTAELESLRESNKDYNAALKQTVNTVLTDEPTVGAAVSGDAVAAEEGN